MTADWDVDRRWVDEHIDELGAYDGHYIAVEDCRVICHGTNVLEVMDRAKRNGWSAPFITRIESGKHIDVYQITGGIQVLPPRDESDPV